MTRYRNDTTNVSQARANKAWNLLLLFHQAARPGAMPGPRMREFYPLHLTAEMQDFMKRGESQLAITCSVPQPQKQSRRESLGYLCMFNLERVHVHLLCARLHVIIGHFTLI